MKLISKTFLFIIICSPACNLNEYALDQDKAEWALPLINGELDIFNLLENSLTLGEIRVGPDGTLGIHYSGEVLQKTKKEIFPPIPGNIPIPMTDTLNEVTLPIVNNMIIHKAVLANGNYWFTYSHQRTEHISLRIWVPELKINGQQLNHLVEIPYSGSGQTTGMSGPNSLDNFEMVPVNNKIGLHYLAFAGGPEPILIPALFFYYDQIDFKYIEGFIGQNTYDLKKDTIELDLYDDFVGGSLIIDDPRVTMTVNSSFGFPAKAIVHTFEMQSALGSSIQLKSRILDEGMFFDYPLKADNGQFKTSTFIFDTSNSNIREVINAQARRVIYDVDALSNPLNVPDSTFFISDSSRFVIHVSVDLPLKGKITQYPATKTFDINAEKLADLDEGILLIQTENGLPLSAAAQIYLYEGSGILIDSVFILPEDLFKPAITDHTGKATISTKHQVEIPMEAGRIQAWSKTKSVRIQVYFNSPSGGQSVRITQPDKLSIKLGFVGKFKS